MQKAVIHYFTGTGNTEHAAKVMSEELKKNSYDTVLIQVRKDLKPPAVKYDLHIVLFPVYALSLPYAMLCYLKKLPDGKGSKASVIANFGMISMKGGLHTGYESRAPEQAAGILRRRGYSVFLTDRVGYPENITILAPSISNENINSIIRAGDKKISEIAEKIIKGEKSIIKYNILDLTFGWLFGFLLMYFGRRQIGKMYIADKDCNACGICVKSCPAGSIRLFRNKPRWNYNCEACLRCYNICPKNAIQVSIIRTGLILGLTIGLIPLIVNNYNKAYNYLLRIISGKLNFPIGENLYSNIIPGIIAYFILFFILFYLIDKIIFILEQIPFVRKIFEWNYTKHFRRYISPGKIISPF